jgi:hypothetical protein
MHPHKTDPSPCLSDCASDASVSIASAPRRRILTAGASIALASALPGLARAQSDWPSKPIRLVVPFPAGGGADLGARAIAVHMGNAFGKPVLVETNTLYHGQRSNSYNHLMQAHEHGFTIEKTGMPVIILDGITGQNQRAVKIPGKHHCD